MTGSRVLRAAPGIPLLENGDLQRHPRAPPRERLGVAFGIGGLVTALYILISRLTGAVVTEGWASTIVVVLLGVGAILFALGIIAEYIGVNVNMAMGKPPYLITTDPGVGPLGRTKPVSR